MISIRATLRNGLIHIINWENYYHAKMQQSLRSHHLDKGMKLLSLFGSTLSFLILIPLLFLLSNNIREYGILFVISMVASVYLCNWFKDLMELPRPRLPVIQLDIIQSHSKEFGFPSTHASLSISIGLLTLQYFGEYLTNNFKYFITLFFIMIIFSRLYLGMHSFCDVLFGCFLGYCIYYIMLPIQPMIINYFYTKNIMGCILPILPMTYLLLITLHPITLSGCPCFMDSVRVIAVFFGVKLGLYLSSMANINFVNNTDWKFLLVRLVIGYFLFFIIFVATEMMHLLSKAKKNTQNSSPKNLSKDNIQMKKITVYLQFYILGFMMTHFIPIFLTGIGV